MVPSIAQKQFCFPLLWRNQKPLCLAALCVQVRGTAASCAFLQSSAQLVSQQQQLIDISPQEYDWQPIPNLPVSSIKPQLHAKLKQIYPAAFSVAPPTKASQKYPFSFFLILSHTWLLVLWVTVPGSLGSTDIGHQSWHVVSIWPIR